MTPLLPHIRIEVAYAEAYRRREARDAALAGGRGTKSAAAADELLCDCIIAWAKETLVIFGKIRTDIPVSAADCAAALTKWAAAAPADRARHKHLAALAQSIAALTGKTHVGILHQKAKAA